MEKLPTNIPKEQPEDPKKSEKKNFGNVFRTAFMAGALTFNSVDVPAQNFETIQRDPKQSETVDQKEPTIVDSKEDPRYIESLERERLFNIAKDFFELLKDPRYFNDRGNGDIERKDLDNWPEDIKIKYFSLKNALKNAPDNIRPVNIKEDDCNICIEAWEHKNKFDALLETPFGRELYGTEYPVPYFAPPEEKVVVLNDDYTPMYKNPTEAHQKYNNRELIGYKTIDKKTGREIYYYTKEAAMNVNAPIVRTIDQIENLYERSMSDIENLELRKKAIEESLKDKIKFQFLLDDNNLDNSYLEYDVLDEENNGLSCNCYLAFFEASYTTFVYKQKDGSDLILDTSKPEEKELHDKLQKGYVVFMQGD